MRGEWLPIAQAAASPRQGKQEAKKRQYLAPPAPIYPASFLGAREENRRREDRAIHFPTKPVSSVSEVWGPAVRDFNVRRCGGPPCIDLDFAGTFGGTQSELLIALLHLGNGLEHFMEGLIGHLDIGRYNGIDSVVEQRRAAGVAKPTPRRDKDKAGERKERRGISQSQQRAADLGSEEDVPPEVNVSAEIQELVYLVVKTFHLGLDGRLAYNLPRPLFTRSQVKSLKQKPKHGRSEEQVAAERHHTLAHSKDQEVEDVHRHKKSKGVRSGLQTQGPRHTAASRSLGVPHFVFSLKNKGSNKDGRGRKDFPSAGA